MDKDGILIVKRHEYEEPHHTQLFFHASNGILSGGTDIYCGVHEIKEIGDSLVKFPQKIGDEYCYTYGTDNPKEKFYRLLKMRVYTTGLTGLCAIQFQIDLNQKEPDEGRCLFSLRAEPAAINRLGSLFIKLSELKHKEFHWSPKTDAIFENLQ